jgi:hypothetical protein
VGTQKNNFLVPRPISWFVLLLYFYFLVIMSYAAPRYYSLKKMKKLEPIFAYMFHHYYEFMFNQTSFQCSKISGAIVFQLNMFSNSMCILVKLLMYLTIKNWITFQLLSLVFLLWNFSIFYSLVLTLCIIIIVSSNWPCFLRKLYNMTLHRTWNYFKDFWWQFEKSWN